MRRVSTHTMWPAIGIHEYTSIVLYADLGTLNLIYACTSSCCQRKIESMPPLISLLARTRFVTSPINRVGPECWNRSEYRCLGTTFRIRRQLIKQKWFSSSQSHANILQIGLLLCHLERVQKRLFELQRGRLDTLLVRPCHQYRSCAELRSLLAKC